MEKKARCDRADLIVPAVSAGAAYSTVSASEASASPGCLQWRLASSCGDDATVPRDATISNPGVVRLRAFRLAASEGGEAVARSNTSRGVGCKPSPREATKA